ncbi:MAG TPA: hypothetical protein VEP90_02840 [Methylomirabilota bacterium]|nr:hypothetical protein [Methylomirabilota bacterium]
MRKFLWFVVMVGILACAVGCSKKKANADGVLGVKHSTRCDTVLPPTWDGSVELRTPVWMGADQNHGGDRWLDSANGSQVEGKLNVHNMLPFHGTLWFDGQQGLRQKGVVRFDNFLKLGMDFPLGCSPFTFTTYIDHRTSFEVDRFMIGLRYDFSGGM